MSFSLQCQGCGASSGPSVGVCPYCKTVLSTKKGAENPSVKAMRDLYEKGDLAQALALGSVAEKEKPKLLESPAFVLLFAQILLEAEAPSSKIRALLQRALMEHPGEAALQEYLEIVNAKVDLSHDKADPGEVALKNLLQRSPGNPHAAFMLGSHLFWVEQDSRAGLVYLERAVKNRPNFLRALACLGALYGSIGAEAQAKKLFQRCVALEKNPEMKKYFQQLVARPSKLP